MEVGGKSGIGRGGGVGGGTVIEKRVRGEKRISSLDWHKEHILAMLIMF